MKITELYCVYWCQNNGLVDIFDTNLKYANQAALRYNKKQNRVKASFIKGTRDGVIVNIFSDVRNRGYIFV